MLIDELQEVKLYDVEMNFMVLINLNCLMIF